MPTPDTSLDHLLDFTTHKLKLNHAKECPVCGARFSFVYRNKYTCSASCRQTLCRYRKKLRAELQQTPTNTQEKTK